MTSFGTGARVALVVAAALGLGGCFYYDSRWGQSAAEQKRAVASMKPGELKRAPGERADAKVYHVGAYATRAYVAETLDWQVRYDTLLRDSSAVLEPALGFSLESAGASVWEPPRGETKLDDVLADLADEDTGDGTDWVVAFIQSTPRFVTDFHVLGKGRLFSKYLVVRAPNDPRELDFLSKEFDEVDQAKKERLYAERKHHKTVSVFLHELAHTLGAVHRTGAPSIMSPAYDPKAVGFDDATLGLLRIAVAARFDESTRADSYRKLVDYLDRTPEGWAEPDRTEEIRYLRATAPAPGTAPAPARSGESAWNPPAPARALGVDALTKKDRQRFDEAVTAEKSDVHAAWSLAEPLFEAAPDVLPVQELRCRLAQKLRFFPAVASAHCARFEALKTVPAAN